MKIYGQTYSQAVEKREGFYAGFLFIVWPFLAMISAFRNYEKPWAKNIFWAFCAFYGFTFAIEPGTGADIVRYVSSYQAMYGQPMSVSQVTDYFLQSGEIDVLRLLISYVLSRFTDSQSALTMVYGAIFGYFLSRNIWFLFERMKGKILPITLFLITCFFLVNPIWQINGFRMWTAVHVFIYGLLPYLFDGKKRGLWISVLSILVHFSMLVPVGVLAGYMLLGNRLNIFFIFFLLTFFVSEIDISAVNTFMENYAPEILQERTDSYRSETVIEADASEPETRNWYIVWHRRALGWSVTGFLVLLFWKGRRFFKENNGWACLFSFTLLFYGVANLLSHLPSGGRFTVIGELCALALIILYIQNRPMEKMMKRFVYLAGPALMLFLIVSIRVGFLYSSVASILGNSIVALFISGEFVSLNNILKSIL